MSLLDALADRALATPPEVDARLKRGRRERDKNKSKRKLAKNFFEGKHYGFLTRTGQLQYRTSGGVGVVGPDKPPHRVRKAVPYIQAIVEAKVSACTLAMPGYEVNPTTNDQDSRQAAALSEQVAQFGFDKWRVRNSRTKTVTNALVQVEGFSVPYFDKNLGPRDEWGEAEGEIRILTFTRDNVSWEPGDDFQDSRWHALERSLRPEEVRGMPGYCGGKLEMPDGTEPDRVNLTEYLERPSRQHPMGRKMFIADNRPMVDFRKDPDCPEGWDHWWEPYPLIDAEDRVIDEPVPHRLVYTVNPDGDDMGLVDRLIDLQTTMDDCVNKLIEWKNRCLVPQMLVHVSHKMARVSDVPGAMNVYSGSPENPPSWEKPMQIPQELFQVYGMCRDEMRSIAADLEIQAAPRQSNDTTETAVAANAGRWASFMGDLAEYDSRMMRHCLVLASRYYTEERKIEIRGQYGWESVQTFTGADLMSQVNVRVGPETLAQTTRAQRQQMVQFLQGNFQGAVTAESAMAYIEGGAAAGLLKSYELQFARVWRIVKALMSGTPLDELGTRWDPDVPNLAAEPVLGPPDPMTGMPTFTAPMGAEVPNWMPADWDNIDIWRTVLGDTLCTEAFERKPEEVREALMEMWRGLKWKEQARAAQAAEMQDMQAASHGTANAAKPQLPAPTPDKAGFSPGSNESAVPTPV